MGKGSGRFDTALASHANQNTYVVIDRHHKQPDTHQHLGCGIGLAVVSLIVSRGEQVLYVVVSDYGLIIAVLPLILIIWTGAGAASCLWPVTTAAALEMAWKGRHTGGGFSCGSGCSIMFYGRHFLVTKVEPCTVLSFVVLLRRQKELDFVFLITGVNAGSCLPTIYGCLTRVRESGGSEISGEAVDVMAGSLKGRTRGFRPLQ